MATKQFRSQTSSLWSATWRACFFWCFSYCTHIHEWISLKPALESPTVSDRKAEVHNQGSCEGTATFELKWFCKLYVFMLLLFFHVFVQSLIVYIKWTTSNDRGAFHVHLWPRFLFCFLNSWDSAFSALSGRCDCFDFVWESVKFFSRGFRLFPDKLVFEW